MSEHRWTAQQAAAITEGRDVLLTANAGTGKTTTVVAKILWSLGLDVAEGPDGPLPPPSNPLDISEIVAITFTEKAAYDLERKLRSEIEASERPELRWRLDEAYIGTIHGFCARLLRENALRLGIDATFRVIDAQDARLAREDIIREVVMDALEREDELAEALARRYPLRGLGEHGKGIIDLVEQMMRSLRWRASHFSEWSSEGELDRGRVLALADWSEADDATFELTRGLHRLAREALARWKDYLLDENVRDFDALVLDARDLLCSPEGASAIDEIRRRCRLLIVDELQDTDFAQRDLAFAIAGDPQGQGPQLFLVGDPKQSIYRFRGADVSVWNEVEASVEDRGVVLSLTESFRSTASVIECVNRAGASALDTTASEVDALGLNSAVPYSRLEGRRPDGEHAGAEYLVVTPNRSEEKRLEEGRALAGRIAEMVASTPVVDMDSGEARTCRYADVAILYRASTDIGIVAQGLRDAGIPFRMAGRPHLGECLEVLDLVNLLRLLHDPGDDLSVFGFLRSPFIGLRDEVIARMRLLGPRGPLLRQALTLLEGDDWSPSSVEGLEAVERQALRDGLQALDDARDSLERRPADEVVDEMLQRCGYREHLVLQEDHEERLANVQGFLRLLEGHRHGSLGHFLQVWDRFSDDDPGIPQAALHAPEDDVVTLSTIHGAKGLEWPVVMLTKLDANRVRTPSHTVVTDPDLGPMLLTRSDERGARGEEILQRLTAEEHAEEARLLYVAMTRARDRLVVTGYQHAKAESCWSWLQDHAAGEILRLIEPAAAAPRRRRVLELDSLQAIETSKPSRLVKPLPIPRHRWLTSATELMLKSKDPERWERRYLHGVVESWQFAPPGDGEGIPADVRGTIIHGVLERIREEAELARLLDETIGALDDPDLEDVLGRGSRYRDALEREIERVVRSPEWAWYTEGEHHRELGFIHLRGAREWRVGAFDLYRPGPDKALVVDFKTHPVKSEEQARRVAEGYAVQRKVYREAGEIRGPTEVELVFTALVGKS